MAKPKIKPDKRTASRIRELRLNRKMTQSELGIIINRRIQAVNAYENTRQGVPKNVLTNIAKALNTSVEYLKGKTDEPNPLLLEFFDDTTPIESLNEEREALKQELLKLRKAVNDINKILDAL